jgi:ribosomal protein L37E
MDYYLYNPGGSDRGPFTRAQLQAKLESGICDPKTRVRTDAEKDYRPLSQVVAMPPPAQNATATLTKCRACGREVSVNAVSCPHCGEPLREAQEKPKQTATGCLAAILIGLIIGGILYWILAG